MEESSLPQITMSTPDTIINYRNMTTVYLVWFGALFSTIIYALSAYKLQYTTPFMGDKSVVLLQWCVILSVIFAILAVLFKYSFKQEFVAWTFLEIIGVLGFVLFLVYGWNIWFYIFLGGQFILLLILGPYLHFD